MSPARAAAAAHRTWDTAVLNGSLPTRALRLIREWARLHEDELAENRERAQALEPLVSIKPLASHGEHASCD